MCRDAAQCAESTLLSQNECQQGLYQAVEKRSERAEIGVEVDERTRTTGTQGIASLELARAVVFQQPDKVLSLVTVMGSRILVTPQRN